MSRGILYSSVIIFAIGLGCLSISRPQKPAIIITRAHPMTSRHIPDRAVLELRSGPADYFPVVGHLSKKDDYQIIDTSGDWHRIAPVRNPASAAWARINPSMR